MAGGRADTFDQRAEILGSIITRNRLITVLRVIVPALGLLAFVALAGQIYLANLARQYGVSAIRVDRGNVVVETPHYAGISASGARYVVTAREARTPLNESSKISMTDVTLELVRPSGTFFAKADKATMDTRTELVKVPGKVAVSGSDGLEGTLTDVESDSSEDTITSNGAVNLTLSDGTTIEAESMFHEGAKQLYTFRRGTVVIPDLPEAEQ